MVNCYIKDKIRCFEPCYLYSITGTFILSIKYIKINIKNKSWKTFSDSRKAKVLITIFIVILIQIKPCKIPDNKLNVF